MCAYIYMCVYQYVYRKPPELLYKEYDIIVE